KSELVREALRRYIEDREWEAGRSYGSARARALGITEADVDRLIHEHRQEKRQKLARPRSDSEAHLATQAKASSRPMEMNFEEDTEFFALCMEELRELEAELGPGTLTIEEAHRILSKVPGSMVEDIDEDRGDR